MLYIFVELGWDLTCLKMTQLDSSLELTQLDSTREDMICLIYNRLYSTRPSNLHI